MISIKKLLRKETDFYSYKKVYFTFNGDYMCFKQTKYKYLKKDENYFLIKRTIYRSDQLSGNEKNVWLERKLNKFIEDEFHRELKSYIFNLRKDKIRRMLDNDNV